MARRGQYDDNRKAIEAGRQLAAAHPLVRPLPELRLREPDALAPGARGLVTATGLAQPSWAGRPWQLEYIMSVNHRRRLTAAEWAHVFARMYLHLALDHLDPAEHDLAWHAACWLEAEEFLRPAKIGTPPADFPRLPTGLPSGAARLAEHFRDGAPIPPELLALSLGEVGEPFWSFDGAGALDQRQRDANARALAEGIRGAASAAVDVAAGARPAMGAERSAETAVSRARAWMIAEFPLLGALAASFTLIEDRELCERMGVSVAAVCDATREIYFNPKIRLGEREARFVYAHEALHAGLRHSVRRQGRDAWLWNVACDFVINDWLLQMQVGEPPEQLGYIHDPELRGLSAEEVYDRIVRDLRLARRLRKARTLNGNACDILDGDRSPAWWRGGGVTLDAFYREALAGGLELHLQQGRGLLPAGLVEEIRALQQPPIPWDVELAQWLDQYFPPLERRRSYARAHRRQSATPDIPRAAWHAPDEERSARVFGALVDTSASMSRVDLGKALGAIASYALSRDVGYVRLICCDAAAHDLGYVEPQSLLDRVELRGRGGTVLMPGVRMLEAADDFPDDGPVLIVTDGACDTLRLRHEHAYLLVAGRLPFRPRGPVFHVS